MTGREPKTILTTPPSGNGSNTSLPTMVTASGRHKSAKDPERMRRRLGNYEIRKFLGKGGMGCVYEGFDIALHRSVAIKELSQQFTSNKELLDRFLREARLVAKLNHENICDIYYMGMDPKKRTPFFAMEFVDGESVDQLIGREGKLSLQQALSIMKQTTKALAVAFEKAAIIHRDVKPANIMLTIEETVKVTDFGLAKLLEGGQSLTRAEVIMGTPHYMSPEAAQGKPCDHRSDIYSLGATFYHMLTGQLPFDGPSAVSVLHKHVNEQLPDIRQCRKGLPPSVAKIIKKMMAKESSGRHQSYGELLQELMTVGESDEKVHEPKTKLPKFTSSLSSIKRRWKIKLGLSAFLIFAAWLFLFGQSGMVYVPAGVYMVGDPKNPESVILEGFYIDQYEVTRGQFTAALGLPAPPRSETNLPQSVFDKREVEKYLEATGKRLPTEEQWQVAACGGGGAAFPWGTDEELDSLKSYVNTRGLGITNSAPVGSYSYDCSPFGCYDMAGNVNELVRQRGRDKEVAFPMGGSFDEELTNRSCTKQNHFVRIYRMGNHTGFRCVYEPGFLDKILYWLKGALTLICVVALCVLL